ncbi:MAG: hypothetical protein M1607_03310 [Patescibacteria group bacterium]|nr:hypothetical protein [Patescibacteria group bacterium]
MDYLKDEQHYIDRYDLYTIEQCLDYYWSLRDGFTKEKDTHFAKYSQEKFEQETNKCLNMMLFTLKGERYRHKKQTIQEWVDKDRKMQELYDNTPLPDVRCKACGSSMKLTHKDLHNSYEPDARMMFMFECIKCNKRQAFFEDGTEWKYDSPKCPKCKQPLKTDLKIKGDITTFTSACLKCGYKDKDVNDHKKWREEQGAKDKKDKELLEKYRAEFCLSDKDGQEYLEYTEIVEYANKVKEEEIRKYDNSYYPKSLQLKKLGIVELENLLTKILEKANYIKLTLEKPEIGQFVIVPFSAQDSNSNRKGHDSTTELQILIKKTLENTNWRLMSEGILYRLGYVSGRLKGVEREEEMYELAGKKKDPKPTPEEEEKRMKYAGNKMVHLAQLMGKLEGIERTKKRRLEKEPDGFILNDGGVGYTCGICGKSINGNETWWDLKGIRCLDCQRNLMEGAVPLEIFDDDYGYDVVVKDSQMNWDYGIHSATLGKLCRQGLLKSRDLKYEDGTIYKRLFLVSENKKFFDEHPKKKPKMEIKFVKAEK